MAGRSLRLRLMVIPAVIVALAIVGVMAGLTRQARERVAAERNSAADLAGQLIGAAIATLPATADPGPALAERIGGLPELRHVRLFVLPRQEAALDRFRAEPTGPAAVPGWFAALSRPAAWEKWWPVVEDGRTLAHVAVIGDPDDELAELWDEMVALAGVMAGLLVLFVALVAWSVGRASRPVAMISAGLARLEQGDYDAVLPPCAIAEIDPVRHAVNRLATTLRRMSDDNRRLIKTLITLQEAERKLLAHELHDELGPTLFAVRAQAAMIARPGGGVSPEAGARTILGLADEVQALNRRILDRLRPLSLHEFGLTAAIGQLVEDWRGRLPDTRWEVGSRGSEPSPDDEAALALYRVVQECLTNAGRHSGATAVTVELAFGDWDDLDVGDLEWNGGPEDAVAYVAVRDDGIGIGAAPCHGFGLLGIRERVRCLGGTARVMTPSGGGTVVEALLPLGRLEDGTG